MCHLMHKAQKDDVHHNNTLEPTLTGVAVLQGAGHMHATCSLDRVKWVVRTCHIVHGNKVGSVTLLSNLMISYYLILLSNEVVWSGIVHHCKNVCCIMLVRISRIVSTFS